MSPIERLILFTACALVAGGIAAVWVFLNVWVSVACILGGGLLAFASTLERVPRLPERPPEEPADPEGTPRAAIVERARASREPDEPDDFDD